MHTRNAKNVTFGHQWKL